MDKYTKALILFVRVPIGVFCILAGLGLLGVSGWVSTFSDVASMILLISFLAGGALINFGVGYAFLGDEYKATHIVRDGNTTFTPKMSEKFLKRRKIVTLTGFIAYVALAVYYVVRMILVSVLPYFQEIDFDKNVVALICFAVLALAVAFCLLMVYKRTKHIDLQEE